MLQISWQSYCHLKSNKRVAKAGQELLKLLKKKCYFWEVSALFTKTVSFNSKLLKYSNVMYSTNRLFIHTPHWLVNRQYNTNLLQSDPHLTFLDPTCNCSDPKPATQNLQPSLFKLPSVLFSNILLNKEPLNGSFSVNCKANLMKDYVYYTVKLTINICNLHGLKQWWLW